MNDKDKVLKIAALAVKSGDYTTLALEKLRKRAKVSNGSFYRIFANRQDLESELYLALLKGYYSVLVNAIDNNNNPRRGLIKLIAAHIAFYTEHKEIARFLFSSVSPKAREIGKRRELAMRREFHEDVTRWRDKPSNSTTIRSDIDVEVLLLQLIGPADALCRDWLAGHIDHPASFVTQLAGLAQTLKEPTYQLLTLPTKGKRQASI